MNESVMLLLLMYVKFGDRRSRSRDLGNQNRKKESFLCQKFINSLKTYKQLDVES